MKKTIITVKKRQDCGWTTAVDHKGDYYGFWDDPDEPVKVGHSYLIRYDDDVVFIDEEV